MKIATIVQARMNSRRLPGKSLLKIRGKPLLEYLLDRLQHGPKVDAMLVATSQESQDDPIAAYCESRGVECFRGSHLDVAGRFYDAAVAKGADAFIRLSGDSPLLDQGLIEKGLEIFRGGKWDLVTNIHVRTYPKGQSVEILRTESFGRALKGMKDPEDREHVTRKFYREPGLLGISGFEHSENLGDLQLSVDAPEDLKRLESILDGMERPHWEHGLAEILKIYGKINGAISRKAAA